MPLTRAGQEDRHGLSMATQWYEEEGKGTGEEEEEAEKRDGAERKRRERSYMLVGAVYLVYHFHR